MSGGSVRSADDGVLAAAVDGPVVGEECVCDYPPHVTDALDGDAAGGDYTGALYALAGIVLIGLALKLAADLLRGRNRERPRSSRGGSTNP